MSEDLSKITEALFNIKATNDEEQPALSDEECGFVYEDDPDSYDEEDEDSEYDQWIEDTYWLGHGMDENEKLQAALDRLETALSYMNDDEHRYYSSEYNALFDALQELEELSKRVETLAGDYSTY